jgi:hypothetical protein
MKFSAILAAAVVAASLSACTQKTEAPAPAAAPTEVTVTPPEVTVTTPPAEPSTKTTESTTTTPADAMTGDPGSTSSTTTTTEKK